ncbi:MAG: hypothetical protein J6K61_02515 [Clostridia bacterium]|nr:hypothetical protein [Clostridia bacterium]
MKRKTMALLMAVLLLFTALPLSAAQGQVRFFVDGEEFCSLSSENLVLPEGPTLKDGRSFVGWKTTKEGQTLLLPAGASVSATSADTFEAVLLSAQTYEKVAVRAEGETVGIRFVSHISKQEYDLLCGLLGQEKVSFGTVIATESYAMKAGNKLDMTALENEGYSYIDIPASKFYKIAPEYNEWAGTVEKLKVENTSQRYAGIGYIKLTYSNGEEGIVYLKAPKTYANGKTNYRNYVTESAFTALLDAYNDRDISYEYMIRENSMLTYSPYTQQSLTAIKTYLDGTVSVKITSNGKYYVEERGLYKSPYKVAFNMSNDIITVTAKDEGELDGLFAIVLSGSYFDLQYIRSRTETACEFRTSAQSPDY